MVSINNATTRSTRILANLLLWLLALQQVTGFVPAPFVGGLPQGESTSRRAALIELVDELSSAYTYSLTHNHMATESASSACLAGIGDLVAQTLSRTNNTQQQGSRTDFEIDWRRYQSFVAKGAVSGILWSHWYAFIDEYSLQMVQTIFTENDSNLVRPLQLALSIMMEQFVWCPLLYSLWDIPFPLLCRGEGDIPEKVKSKLAPLLVENAKVWTFANLVVYNIPLEWRVVMVSLTDVVWQSILSSSISSSSMSSSQPTTISSSSTNDKRSPVPDIIV